MEVHQLRYMVAVAKTGTFSRAAEVCHVSQPTLSQQIHKLEDELGERLFDRLRRQARLTAAGGQPTGVSLAGEAPAAAQHRRPLAAPPSAKPCGE